MILSSGLYLKVQERGDKARAAEGLPPEEADSALSPREVARDLIEAGGVVGRLVAGKYFGGSGY